MPENFVKTDKLDSAYRLVILAAKRSKELTKGAEPRVDSPAHKNTTVAIQEIKAGVVDWDHLERKVPTTDIVTSK
jgi:DNA-directed RNA polymerase subunit omega